MLLSLSASWTPMKLSMDDDYQANISIVSAVTYQLVAVWTSSALYFQYLFWCEKAFSNWIHQTLSPLGVLLKIFLISGILWWNFKWVWSSGFYRICKYIQIFCLYCIEGMSFFLRNTTFKGYIYTSKLNDGGILF